MNSNAMVRLEKCLEGLVGCEFVGLREVEGPELVLVGVTCVRVGGKLVADLGVRVEYVECLADDDERDELYQVVAEVGSESVKLGYRECDGWYQLSE